MKPRRLVIQDTAGKLLLADALGRPLPHWQIDLTGIPHASAQVAMHAIVQEQCNLGCWHDTHIKLSLPCWGAD